MGRNRRKPKKELIPVKTKMLLAGLFMLAGSVFITIKQGFSSLAAWSFVIAVLFLSYPSIATCVERHRKDRNRRKYLRSSLYDIDHMEGNEFEEWAKAWYEAAGYTVDTTPSSNDYGADLLADNGEEFIAVQCKRYMGKVGVAAVQQIIGAVAYYKADRGEVMTNSYFTAQAKTLALETGVKLYDRNSLIEMPKLKDLPPHGAEEEGGLDG